MKSLRCSSVECGLPLCTFEAANHTTSGSRVQILNTSHLECPFTQLWCRQNYWLLSGTRSRRGVDFSSRGTNNSRHYLVCGTSAQPRLKLNCAKNNTFIVLHLFYRSECWVSSITIVIRQTILKYPFNSWNLRTFFCSFSPCLVLNRWQCLSLSPPGLSFPSKRRPLSHHKGATASDLAETSAQ